MPEMLSPGVYSTEVDFSAYIQSQSTSVFGLLGVFEKGPVGVATLVTSFEDAKNQFGSYLDGHFGLFALKNFFDNGGSRAFVSRVVHYAAGSKSSVAASVNIVDRAGTPAQTLKVEALTDGAHGNSLAAKVEASDAFPTTGFNLVVKKGGVVVETFKDLLLGAANTASEDHVEKRINGVSAFIKVTDLFSVTAAPANLPKLSGAASGEALASGEDGLTGLVPSDFLGDSVTGAPGLTALDAVEVNFVAIPGEGTRLTGQTLAAGLIAYAEGRKDAIAICEVPQGLSVTEMVDFRMGTGAFSATGTAFNSSYGALYGPWLTAKHPVTARDIVLPPSGFVAGIFARSDAAVGVWAAPAGLNRGGIVGATGPNRRLTQSDIALLYPKQVNPIAVVVNTLIVDGQRTLLLKASKLSNVGTRRSLAYLEKAVKDAAQFLVMELNSPRTWQAFIRLVEPFVRDLTGRGAFNAYRVVCDAKLNTPAVTNQNQMLARVQVIPVGYAEFIGVEFSIAPDGTSFTEL